MNDERTVEERRAAERERRRAADERRQAVVAEAIASRSGVLIRNHEACALLGVTRISLWRWERRGLLPKPVRIGGVSGWPAKVLADVMAGRGKAA